MAMSAIIGERNLVERSCKVFFLIRCSPFVMVLFGLLGDVHKDNFTWNLKAFDEFQSLIIFAGRVESRFSFQNTEFLKSHQTTNIFPSDSHKPKLYLELKVIVEHQENIDQGFKSRFLFSLFLKLLKAR